MDLLTVACALHWFDIPRFFAEARRVLKPYGILAAWVYSWPETGIPEIDSILAAYKDEILGSYWPEESRYYFNCYRDIDFPFERLENPPFHLTCPWGPKETLEFLSTWSGPQRYYEATGQASAERISEPLEDAWRKAEFKGPIYLPLYLYVGRID
jgi:SAM-dependent methyltransferase